MKEKLFREGIKKRLASIALVLAMVLTLMPMNSFIAHAEDVVTYQLELRDDGYAYKAWSTKVEPLPDGLSFANGEWTMENFHFVSNCSGGGVVQFKGENVLNIKGNNTIKSENASYPTAFSLYPDAKLTIKGTGNLECSTGDASSEAHGIKASSGELIIESGTITVKPGIVRGEGTVKSIGIQYKNLTINGGTLNCIAGNSDNWSFGIWSDNDGVLTVNGGTVHATGQNGQNSTGIATGRRSVIINGGEIIAIGGTGTSRSVGLSGYNVEVNGGSITANGGDAPVSYGLDPSSLPGLTINGGEVIATGKSKAINAGRTCFKIADNLAIYVGSAEDSVTYKANVTEWSTILNDAENTFAKLTHKHVASTNKHDATSGTCKTPGTIEWYECSISSCNKKLDASGDELSSIDGELDPTKHEETATTWVKTESTHEGRYSCCNAAKSAEEAHSYGTNDEARYTCTVCGYVDSSKKDVADTADANAVISKINAIGTVVLTDECKGKIDVARDAYDALTADLKAKITSLQYKVLTDAETKYKALLNAGKYEGVETASGEVKDITGTEEAPKETNHYSAAIKNNTELETLIKVSPAEKAQGVNVWVEVIEAAETMPTKDKAVIDKTVGKKTVGIYLDATLFKKVGDNDAEAVHELNGKIKVSLVVPEKLRKEGRTFEIIRVHDGEPTTISGTYDKKEYTFTFETDRFSSYALTYQDEEAEDANKGDDSSKDKEAATPTPSESTPKTGDTTNMYQWIILMIAGLGVCGVAYSRKRKEN